LGDGSTNDTDSPVSALLANSISQVSTSGNHTCALLTSGGLRCWGNNDFGQLGNETFETRIVPSYVTGFR
jgi:alpha-tubulin suppressor-like RCC1 family protein